MSTFQLFVTSLFVAFTIFGVGVFALFGGALGGGGVGAVVVWGTEGQETVTGVLDVLRAQDKSLQDVTYVQKDEASYRSELLNAMASGRGPDLFIVAQSDMYAFSDKIIPISYGTISQSNFVSSYVDMGQLFLTSYGALALPFTIDPLVMYWNRDLFAGAGISQTPRSWNEFLNVAPKITSLDATKSVTRSAVALGEWGNVVHAKEILSALFMQAGDSIVVRGSNNALESVFGVSAETSAVGPAESALRFYTEFANPSKTTYSWNKSLPRSDGAFVGGQLAVYFGFASEYPSIVERNPNLRFGVAVVPQLSSGARITSGRLTGLAIPRTARNVSGATVVAQKLSSREAAAALFTATGFPPVRRDLALDTSSSAVAATFVESALIARGWQDPDPTATDAIFKTMIESVVSGRSDPATAVGEAAIEFSQLTPRQ